MPMEAAGWWWPASHTKFFPPFQDFIFQINVNIDVLMNLFVSLMPNKLCKSLVYLFTKMVNCIFAKLLLLEPLISVIVAFSFVFVHSVMHRSTDEIKLNMHVGTFKSVKKNCQWKGH